MNRQVPAIASRSHVLVTGGAGFVGSHLVEQLVAADVHVTVVDNLSTGHSENVRTVLSKIDLIDGDFGHLLQTKQLRFDAYEYVFHLAANPYIPSSVENPGFDFQTNLCHTFELLEALRNTPNPPRLINVSSGAVYGNPTSLPMRETDPTVPISPYGVSKLAAERYVAVYSQIYGLCASSVRLFSVYGPRQRKQVVYDLLRKLRADPTRLEVLGNGSQSRDFTYVLDVVQAMTLVARYAPGRGEVYNLASGRTHSIAELVSTWCDVCDLSPEVEYTGRIRPGDAEQWVVDITRLKQLGFEAKTDLRNGLAAIRDWYDAHI